MRIMVITMEVFLTCLVFNSLGKDEKAIQTRSGVLQYIMLSFFFPAMSAVT